MNYYSHHIGDYSVSTAHLSILEDGTYRRLMDRYYATEAALPSDDQSLFRVIRARSEEEQEAVRIVLQEFFTLTDEGWCHKRCDAEISAYKEKSVKAADAANKRWNKPSNANAMPPQCERIPNAMPTKNQEPITKNQEPVKEKIETRGTRLSPDWVAETEHVEFCKTERPDLDPIAMQDKFRDYWTGVPGKGGLKLNWFGTWKNFIRTERKQQPRASPSYQTQSDKAKTFLDQLTGKTGNDNIIDIN